MFSMALVQPPSSETTVCVMAGYLLVQQVPVQLPGAQQAVSEQGLPIRLAPIQDSAQQKPAQLEARLTSEGKSVVDGEGIVGEVPPRQETIVRKWSKKRPLFAN